MKRLDPVWIALVLAIAPAAAAQDTYRQTVVVTAAATPVELGSVTRSVVVVTREQIAALPVASIADLLRLASSVDIRARGERGVQSDFGVRGAGFGQMLVLVDGIRINDAQSGHHNGDIPVPLDLIDRVEILYGAGSSLFGADASGGTVNVITRRNAHAASVTVQGGSFGAGQVRGTGGGVRGPLAQTLGASFDRSGGFIDGRDFKTAVLHSGTAIGGSSHVSVSYLWKDFGARNFYGAAATGDALSRERTNQTLVAADHTLGSIGGWRWSVHSSYRTHGDRFAFTPGSAASVHRTHEALGTVGASRRVAEHATMTVGAEGGGTWIRSNNLGNHAGQRISGFGEWRQEFGTRLEVDGSVRLDRYSEFGTSSSPAGGISWWAAPRIRVRASGGRAFRVPTFTERYYSDRNHLARPAVGPEHSWSGEAGVDVFPGGDWLVQATAFGRADTDVIDWLCSDRTCGTPAATDRWHTYNVRDVDTRGVELSVRRSFASGAFAQAGYTGLTVDAPALAQMSKYVADYSPHSFVAAGMVPLRAGIHVAPRLEVRRRVQTTGTSDYALLDFRISRRLGSLYEVAIDGTNVLGADYQEVLGVRMPGRAVMASLTVGGR
jgi:iron complex outermembrane receptor protein